VRGFRDELTARGVNATIRVTRGADIDAACGQLAASAIPGAGAAGIGRAVRLARRVTGR
jgi:23S rRNA (adenine2503-C2)-methyltransferase